MSGLAARKERPGPGMIVIPEMDLLSFLREPLLSESLDQTEIPRLARNPHAMNLLEQVLLRIPTRPLSGARRCAANAINSSRKRSPRLDLAPVLDAQEIRRGSRTTGPCQWIRRIPRRVRPRLETLLRSAGPRWAVDLRSRRCVPFETAKRRPAHRCASSCLYSGALPQNRL